MIMTAAMSAWSFLKNGWRSIALALLAALAFQTVRIEGFWFINGYKERVATLRIDLAEARKLRMLERANHQRTKANYRAAQFEAARLESARLARVTARQKEITDDVAQDFARRLADVRARAERLRHQAGPGAGAGGSPRCEPVPGVPVGTGGIAQAPADCGLPRADQLERDVIASEQAEQLDALITFVERQAAVDPNERPR